MIFKNIKNTILVFSENYYCYLNLMFSIFYVFQKKNKEPIIFFLFLRTENDFKKQKPNRILVTMPTDNNPFMLSNTP